MSTSTSTRTYQITEGNTVKTITEKTVTTPDGRTTTTKEEKTETKAGGGNARQPTGSSQMKDGMMKQFNDMKIQQGGRGGPSSKSSGGAKPTATQTPAGGSGASSGPSDVSLKDFREQALKAHNERRSKHQVGPLKYSSDLNDYAQNWADHLVNTGTFQHSDCMLSGGRLGENIANKWSSDATDYTGEEAVQQWYSEISKYDYSKDRNMGTGHFTQVVWKDSSELGMGKAKSKDGKVIVVGSYRPAGNFMGAFKQNVFAPK